MHDKTARPTVRLLQEDLKDGWTNSYERRAAAQGHWDDLHPFAAVQHPLISKCAESLPDNPGRDITTQVISSSGDLRLTEIRMSQWRAGVWTDPNNGVRWIVAAGLAKGGHEDNDDFYEQLKAKVAVDGGEKLMPDKRDLELLRIETAAKSLLQWERGTQEATKEELACALQGEPASFDIGHPLQKQSVGTVKITHEVVDDLSELVVEFILTDRHQNSDLGWLAITRILNGLYPPVQGWDRYGLSFSIMGPVGFLENQLARLEESGVELALVEGELGITSHYAHRRSLAEKTIEGKSVRALCGVFFVPAQDHDKFIQCPSCAEKIENIKQLVPGLE